MRSLHCFFVGGMPAGIVYSAANNGNEDRKGQTEQDRDGTFFIASKLTNIQWRAFGRKLVA